MRRGYWARAVSIRNLVYEFIELKGDKQIINLGAGLDSLGLNVIK